MIYSLGLKLRIFGVRFYIDQTAKDFLIDARWQAERFASRWTSPDSIEFCDELLADSGQGWRNVYALPDVRVIFVSNPKVASSSLKRVLARAANIRRTSLISRDNKKFGKPLRLRELGPIGLYRLATNPGVFRFSFVRNPYDRLVSCWSDKFQNKPLVASRLFHKGEPVIDTYFRTKVGMERRLPNGPKELSFADFVTYATAICHRPNECHVQLQSQLLHLPGLPLDFVGRAESFAKDITQLLDHLGADDELRMHAQQRLRSSRRSKTADYYNPEIAAQVYRAYERDFDTYKYPQALPG